MLNLQRKWISVSDDYRSKPRIEFHFPVAIIGGDSQARIVDFSLSGFYIETDSVMSVAPNQKINLALKLPGEYNAIRLKAEVVHRDARGFGCKFCDMAADVTRALENCFNIFSGTLPVS